MVRDWSGFAEVEGGEIEPLREACPKGRMWRRFVGFDGESAAAQGGEGTRDGGFAQSRRRVGGPSCYFAVFEKFVGFTKRLFCFGWCAASVII